jgi:hypothetical protein
MLHFFIIPHVQSQSNRVCNFHVILVFLMLPKDNFFQIIKYFDSAKMIMYTHVYLYFCRIRMREKKNRRFQFAWTNFDFNQGKHFIITKINFRDIAADFNLFTVYIHWNLLHIILLPLTFFVMLISHRPLGVILTVNASVPRD